MDGSIECLRLRPSEFTMIPRSMIALLPALLAGAVLCGGAGPVVDDDETVTVEIAKLTSIEYRRGKGLPADIQELDGKRIRIEGYMGIGTLEGVESFELVPEACECGRSKVQHFIDVTLTEGLTVYRPERITIGGTFSAGEVEEDGFVVSLYRMTITSLEQ